jgi:putative glycosyltransferase
MTMDASNGPEISIVATLYRSMPYVRQFCERASSTAQSLVGDSFELILVNDGSPDDSLAVALEMQATYPQLTVIDLSRNFGQHKAIMTGLSHALGRLVFVLDSDLEEEPEWLALFRGELMRTGADVVYGVQQKRKGGLGERVSGALFYRLFNWATDGSVPPNQTCARLMSRRYVDNLIQHKEREVFLQGLWSITGFTQVGVAVVKGSKGETSYSFAAKTAMFVNAITAFSNRPLVGVFYLGVGISASAFVAAVYLVVRRLFFGVYLTGWPSLMVSIWLLGGLIIFCLGVLGIYLSKIFSEVKNRPYTVVRKIHASSHYPAARSGASECLPRT